MKKATIKNLQNNLSQIKLERQIASYLKKKLPAEEIFKLIKNDPDLESLSEFLYNSGFHKELLKMNREFLKNHKHVAWVFVLPLIIKTNVKINKSESKILYHTWLKNYAKNYPSIFSCKKWEEYSQEFSDHLNAYLEKLKEQTISEDDKLLETLDFLRAQNLMDEESKIIQKLLTKNPQNKKYQNLQKSLRERRAIKTIEDQKMVLYKSSISNDATFYFTPEDSKIKHQWSQIVQDLSKKMPSQAKNLSLFLYFLDWPDESIKILKTNLKNYSDYWFYLDCLMETGQHTKSLDFINQLLQQVKDPEMIFPLVYMKSQTLYYLGKKEEAIEYLNNILQIRPDYRSAQSLLEKWTKN